MDPLCVLVLGGEGMLGQACVQRLGPHTDWIVEGTRHADDAHPLSFEALDDSHKLGTILSHRPYRYVINCIGILSSAIDDSNSRSVRSAIEINSLFPHRLAEAAARHSARVIHISTDGVFSGTARTGYREDSPLDCWDTYGKTKALGECPAENVLNIRCSIVGRDRRRGKGLVEWLLKSPSGTKISGFRDYYWTGATTLQVAELFERMIESGTFERLREESPIHHFAPNRPLSKYEFLTTLKSVAEKSVDIQPVPSPHGPIRRVLATRFHGLRQLYQPPGDWPEVLREVVK